MCLLVVCDEPERVVATYQAPGRCPYCGGGVVAADVESAPRLCYFPLCFRMRRRTARSACAVSSPSPDHRSSRYHKAHRASTALSALV
ncbi:hypothetical protein BS78_04G129600 [Paspalum vaginatum]|nr:hypothetical protein BS78_04G129600 [Paspalum vaginatum]